MEVGVKKFFDEDVSAFVNVLERLDSRLGPNAEPRKDDHYHTTLDAFEKSCEACRRMETLLENDPERLKEVKSQFREVVCPWLDRSWYFKRARTKPRGYPGDGELLSAIYDNVPRGRGLVGYLDLFFLNTTLACAVRERLRCAKTFLVGELERRHGDVSILNVACGPIREYEGGLEHPEDTNVNIICLDTDRETLDYVESRSAAPAMRDLNISCVCYNAIRTGSAQNNIRRFNRPNIIYSIGLCDYIPDKHLIPMLQGWRETVTDDGVVYVAFKDARRYMPTVYQWHVDWYFFLRTEEDCRSLFEQAGYDMYDLKMTRDPTGSIINFIGRNKTPSHIRIDRPVSEGGAIRVPAARVHAEPVAVSN
jgi:extracellular factor (EF) 3-hydroxypalmitic acid methyl ester biosynthesis protein